MIEFSSSDSSFASALDSPPLARRDLRRGRYQASGRSDGRLELADLEELRKLLVLHFSSTTSGIGTAPGACSARAAEARSKTDRSAFARHAIAPWSKT